MAIFMSSSLHAADVEKRSSAPAELTHASWVFSGVVTNESGESYGYFFQMQRRGEQFHSIAALLDGQDHHVILFDESETTMKKPIPYHWNVGRAFMQFNPINNSWIFGLKTQDKKGFNFKVDLIKQMGQTWSVQNVRSGVALLVNQTGHLNGHIQSGKESKEQFITAKNAWFRQIWLTGHEDEPHPFTGVLCRFHDGSGFYSLNMLPPDTLQGPTAGWCDEQGTSSVMSQFISVKQEAEGPWHIRVTSPNLHLILADVMEQNTVVAGFVQEGKTTGFCMLSQDAIGGNKEHQAL